jgi:hypothetical protein
MNVAKYSPVMPLLVSFIEVHDGIKFFEYLKSLGCQISEEVHSVLPDSSEYGLYTCIKDNDIKALFALHYIDHHYAALLELEDNASDREVVEALLRAKDKGVWIAPVEYVLFVPLDYTVIKNIASYVDEMQDKVSQYLEYYEKSESPWKNMLKDFTPALIAFSKEGKQRKDNNTIIAPHHTQ